MIWRASKAGEPVLFQAFIPEAPVEALHKGILYRLSRADERQRDEATLTIDFDYLRTRRATYDPL
jgi:hypothetical protein